MASMGTALSKRSCMRSSSAGASAPRARSGWLVTTITNSEERRKAATAGRTPGSRANSASLRGDTLWPSRATSRFSTPALSRNTARRMSSLLLRAGANPVGQAKRHQVMEHNVERFHVRRGVVGHHLADIGQVLHRAAVEPRKAQGIATLVPGILHGTEQGLRPQRGFVAPDAAVHLMPTTTSPVWNSDFNCSTYTFSQPSSLVSALSKGMLSTKLIARSRSWFGTIVHLHRSAARWEAVPAEPPFPQVKIVLPRCQAPQTISTARPMASRSMVSAIFLIPSR